MLGRRQHSVDLTAVTFREVNRSRSEAAIRRIEPLLGPLCFTERPFRFRLMGV